MTGIQLPTCLLLVWAVLAHAQLNLVAKEVSSVHVGFQWDPLPHNEVAAYMLEERLNATSWAIRATAGAYQDHYLLAKKLRDTTSMIYRLRVVKFDQSVVISNTVNGTLAPLVFEGSPWPRAIARPFTADKVVINWLPHPDAQNITSYVVHAKLEGELDSEYMPYLVSSHRDEAEVYGAVLPLIGPGVPTVFRVEAEVLPSVRTHPSNVTDSVLITTQHIDPDPLRTVTFPAVADTFVLGGIDYGMEELLTITDDAPSNSSYAYVKFDLTTLDKQCVFDSIHLLLSFSNATYGTLRIYTNLDRDWDEASFGQRPLPVHRELLAALYHPVAFPNFNHTQPSNDTTRITLDYADSSAFEDIKLWRDGSKNYGVLIEYDTSDVTHFHSRESMAPELRPTLEVECAVVSYPVANDDTFPPTDEDTPVVTGNVLANDNDADGDVLEVVAFDTVSRSGATVSAMSNGVFHYDPTASPTLQGLALGMSVIDRFSYTIDDGTFRNATANVTITVNGLNDAPVANADSNTTSEDSLLVIGNLLDNDVDVDIGDELSIHAVDSSSAMSAAVLMVDNRTVSYDPRGLAVFDALSSGDTLFDTFQYLVRDSNGELSSPATVTVVVTGLNDRPFFSLPNTVIPLTNVTEDDASPPGDSLDLLLNSGVITDADSASTEGIAIVSSGVGPSGRWEFSQNGGALWQPVPGTLSVSAALVLSDNVLNRIRFVPLADFYGNATLTVHAWDLTDLSAEGSLVDVSASAASATSAFSSASATLLVHVVNEPDAPVALDDMYGVVTEATAVVLGNVLLNDTDADDADLLALSVCDVQPISALGATVAVADPATGMISYDTAGGAGVTALNEGEPAVDSFWYTVCDDGTPALRDNATVYVDVLGVNTAPVAVDDFPITDEDTAILIEVTANDVEFDTADSISIISPDGSSSAGAIVTVLDSHTIRYDPSGAATLQQLGPSQVLLDSFTYTIADSSGLTSSAIVTVNVTGVNDAPVAMDDTATADEDSAIMFDSSDLTANDMDVEMDMLSVTGAVSPSAMGAMVMASAASFQYDPTAAPALQALADGQTVIDTVVYTVEDPNGGTAQASVLVTVSGFNDAPVLDDSGDPSLDPVALNDMNPPGTTVSAVIDSMASYVDVDNGALRGLAVTSVGMDGSWEYSLDGGGSWTAIGSPMSTSAVVLPDTPLSRVRFVPDMLFNGASSIDVRAWDQTDSAAPGSMRDATNAGLQAPYSLVEETVTVVVVDSNTQPVLVPNGLATIDTIMEDVQDASNPGTAVSVILAVLDITDSVGALEGLAIIDAPTSAGVWQFTKNGGALWTAVGAVSASNALLLSSSTPNRIRFRPNPDYFGSSAITVKAWDRTFGSNGAFLSTVGSSAFSSNSDTVRVTVTPVNDPPIAVDDGPGVGFSAIADTPFATASVLANDLDVEMDALSVFSFDSASAEGAQVVAAGSGFVYHPENAGQLIALAAGDVVIDTFEYIASDGTNQSAPAVVRIHVTGVNDGLTANDDSLPDVSGGLTTIFSTLLANDTDLDGDSLRISSADSSSAGGAAVAVTSLVDVSYNPLPSAFIRSLAQGELFADSFHYTATDGEFFSSATVSFNVVGVNDPCQASNDAASTNEDTAILIPVLDNDSDPDTSDVLSIVSPLGTSVKGATLTIVGSAIQYSPGASTLLNALAVGEVTTDTFTYTIRDIAGPSGTTSTATVTVTVSGLNDAVQAFDDSGAGFITTAATAFITSNVLSNDVDPDGDPLGIASVSPTSLLGASVSIHSPVNGQLRYDPTVSSALRALGAGQQMVDQFTYTCGDTHGTQASATVFVTVNGVNDPPTTVDDNVMVSEKSSLVMDPLLNDFDVDTGDVISLVTHDSLSSGFGVSIVDMTGQLLFDAGASPALTFLSRGESVLDEFEYVITDGRTTSTGTVFVTINGENDVPLGVDDGPFATVEDQVLLIGQSLLLQNDEDPDHLDTLHISSVDPSALGADVSLTATNVRYDPRNSMSIQALALGVVMDDTFEYTVSDGELSATATVTVRITGVNDAVSAADDVDATNEDTAITTVNVLANDSDPDGDMLSVVNFQNPSTRGAKVVSNGDGTFSYDPRVSDQLQRLSMGESVVDTFTYMVSDGKGSAGMATVRVTVNGRNDACVAIDDTVTEFTLLRTGEDDELAPATFSVLSNDVHDTTDVLHVSTHQMTSDHGAHVTVLSDGRIRYDPSQSSVLNELGVGEELLDSFTYVCEGHSPPSAASEGRVVIRVTGANDAPVCGDDMFVTDEDSLIITGSVLANDNDPDKNDQLTVDPSPVTFTTGLLASVRNLANGSFAYDPTASSVTNALQVGDQLLDHFQYVARDGHGGVCIGRVQVEVNGENDPPRAMNDAGVGYRVTRTDVLVTPSVLLNDVDPENDPLHVQSTSPSSALGAFVMSNLDGTLTYDPTGVTALGSLLEGESVQDTFTYVVADDRGLTSTATVTVVVDGSNAVATAAPDASPSPSPSPTPTPTGSTMATSRPTILPPAPSSTPEPDVVPTPTASTPVSSPPPATATPTPTATATPTPLPPGGTTVVIPAGGQQEIGAPDQDDVVLAISDPLGPVVDVSIPANSAKSTTRIVLKEPDPVTIASATNTQDVRSRAISIDFLDDAGGMLQPEGDIELCFFVGDSRENRCLGFLDESVSPPEWKCEDDCLKEQDGQLCGTASHLTSFAVLFSGSGGSASACGEDDGNTIFGNIGYDIALIGGITGIVVCACLVFAIVVTYVAPVRRVVHGEEMSRLRQVRKAASKVKQGSSEEAEEEVADDFL